ncbi:hypothetical protein PAJ34TS1_12950 [Paenibacillus azoreducens]|uniref:Uncharacterized protein n=1 Tax=Paenibacillus azoreducens TaxID=116718 RepID=A0A919YF40_9BACL|nr:hypothetical protein J34TS1_52910 [Paenibacillus azoreducens]
MLQFVTSWVVCYLPGWLKQQPMKQVLTGMHPRPTKVRKNEGSSSDLRILTKPGIVILAKSDFYRF